MKRFSKGPELKVPEVLNDLYLDLRDRRLLPLLALVIVAIAAVPFLLGGKSPEVKPTVPNGFSAQGAARASDLTVVKATPGLRDYRKRLRSRTPTDPFKQKFTAPVLSGAKLKSKSDTSGQSETSTSTTTGGSGAVPPVESGGSGGGNGGGAPPHLKIYTWNIKLQLSHTEAQEDGSVVMGEPEVREHVKPLTPLPGKKTPVVTLIGFHASTGKVVVSVSHEVTAVFGEAKCVSGTDTCELLELEKGFPEIFEYGPNHVRYKLTIVNVDLVPTGKS